MRWKPMMGLVGRGVLNVRNKYVSNDAAAWDTMYQSGYAQKLESDDQRPRNYVIAGLVADSVPPHARILDVGCGVGTTLGLLKGHAPRYVGIDLSAHAVEHCRQMYDGVPSASFEVAPFEAFRSETPFDVIVLNEVLYYFPLARVRELLEKSISLLRDRRSLLLISMSKNPKAILTWLRCQFLPPPVHRIEVGSRGLGSRWTVCAYSSLK